MTRDEATPAQTEATIEEVPAAMAHQVEVVTSVDDECRPSSSRCDDPAVAGGTAEPSDVKEPTPALGGMNTVVVDETEAEAQAEAQPETEVVVAEEREETTGDGEFLKGLVVDSVIYYVCASLVLIVCNLIFGGEGGGCKRRSEW